MNEVCGNESETHHSNPHKGIARNRHQSDQIRLDELVSFIMKLSWILVVTGSLGLMMAKTLSKATTYMCSETSVKNTYLCFPPLQQQK